LIRPIFETPLPSETTKKADIQPINPDKGKEISIPNKLTRAPKSTSLKNLIKEPDVVSQANLSPKSKLATPFNEEDLVQYWDEFAESLAEKAHLKNTMINCKPVLGENFKFEVKVHNPAQQEALISNSLDLLKLLRTRLINDQVQMVVRIDENTEQKPVYTSTEKFEFLNNINPLLSKLIDEFNLSID